METSSSKTGVDQKPQREQKHPDQWADDLNPNRMSGQNIGPLSASSERGVRTAYDVKEVHQTLGELGDEELKRIPILPAGTRLQQGATYVDLRGLERTPFTAMGDMTAKEMNWYTPKDQVPPTLWNRLIGVENPERR